MEAATRGGVPPTSPLVPRAPHIDPRPGLAFELRRGSRSARLQHAAGRLSGFPNRRLCYTRDGACGSSSVVERLLAKEEVASSTLVFRSTKHRARLWRAFCLLAPAALRHSRR